eukprot:m.210703 g.210703  ORF g.210703 m.210703 type:complete len:170 (+) comp15488_c0_seq1:3435-3944(+)
MLQRVAIMRWSAPSFGVRYLCKAATPPADPTEHSSNELPRAQWMISTPHPGSRIRKRRPLVPLPSLESEAEQKLRVQLDDDFEWHHKFWSTHNKNFEEARSAFTGVYKRAHGLGPSDRVPADDMSEFYQDFLISTAEQHREYSRQWRRRNLSLLWLQIQSMISRVFQNR